MLRSVLPLAALSMIALSGCPNNTVPEVYSIADWHLRCDSMMLSCTPPPERMVTGFNGASGNSVSCSVMETATERIVTFTTGSSTAGTNYSVNVTAARVPRGGGFAGAGCTVRVIDGANTFSGVCGAIAPTTTQPCQVQIMFGNDMVTGSTTLHAEVLCDHLPNAAAPSQLRSLFQGAGSPEPAYMDFFDCRGLSAM